MHKLAKLRRAKGLSQRALAKKAGLANATIIKLESKQSAHPYPSTLKKLADGLGVHIRDVLSAFDEDLSWDNIKRHHSP